MTRIADSSNEDYLLMIAHYGTAQHVEQLISKYRRCKRTQELAEANRQHARRELSIRYDDGSVVFRGRLPAEQGALVMKALELAMERAAEVTAETSASEDTGEIPEREPYHVRRADALMAIAETSLNAEPREASTADRYQVVVHVTAETSSNDSDGNAHLEDGPHVTAETSRRIACDCSVVGILEDGEVRFRDARNEKLPDYILPTPVPDDATIEDWMVSRMNSLDIDADTCTPRWEAGNRIDWNMAVGALFPN